VKQARRPPATNHTSTASPLAANKRVSGLGPLLIELTSPEEGVGARETASNCNLFAGRGRLGGLLVKKGLAWSFHDCCGFEDVVNYVTFLWLC
jgi:hypothetical protein